ncbi:hypothetical protein [Staphylococcus simulans]|uniref:hypothetical protein n=1 Tax=Staphylococcus simulans TaxID=1286 RepID=UPI003F7DB7B5
MKRLSMIGTALVASALIFSGIEDVADGAEAYAAKAVTGEELPDSTDPDGDGWANVGFENLQLDEPYQSQLLELTKMKDSGQLEQAEYNEKVAELVSKAREVSGNEANAQASAQQLPYSGEADQNLVWASVGLLVAIAGAGLTFSARTKNNKE